MTALLELYGPHRRHLVLAGSGGEVGAGRGPLSLLLTGRRAGVGVSAPQPCPVIQSLVILAVPDAPKGTDSNSTLLL